MPWIVKIRGQRPAVVFNKEQKASADEWDKMNNGYVLIWPAENGRWFKMYKEKD